MDKAGQSMLAESGLARPAGVSMLARDGQRDKVIT